MRARMSVVGFVLLAAFALGPLAFTGHSLPVGVCGESMLVARGRLSTGPGSNAILLFETVDGTTYRVVEGANVTRACPISMEGVDANLIGWVRPCLGPLFPGTPVAPWIVVCDSRD